MSSPLIPHPVVVTYYSSKTIRNLSRTNTQQHATQGDGEVAGKGGEGIGEDAMRMRTTGEAAPKSAAARRAPKVIDAALSLLLLTRAERVNRVGLLTRVELREITTC